MSHTGHVLSRNRAFRFAADPTVAQSREFFMCAGARRYMFNHHIGRVKENLDVRRAEAAAGVGKDEMTGSISWSKVSFINECNAWKNGQLDTSPVNDDGTHGLAWRHEVPADVFECASADAAQSLANFSNSVKGVRKGKKAGFATFKARHRTTPSFRLRSRSKPGASSPVRVTGPRSIRRSSPCNPGALDRNRQKSLGRSDGERERPASGGEARGSGAFKLNTRC